MRSTKGHRYSECSILSLLDIEVIVNARLRCRELALFIDLANEVLFTGRYREPGGVLLTLVLVRPIPMPSLCIK